MVLSRRERTILIGVLAALAALALDRFALTPLMNARAAVRNSEETLTVELERARLVRHRRDQMEPKWREMIHAGLKGDPAEAESRILHAIRDWAEESGVSLSLLKPDRLAEKSVLPQIAFQAAGTGKMSGISRLLWKIQTASIPVRLTEVQLGARKEGADDLSFQFRLSTIHAPAPATQAAGERASARGGA